VTKTFRDNCDINIVEQTSCEPLFPDVQMQLKMYFFISFVRPCIHHNYGGISGSHACKDCVWPIILDAELCTTCPGERVLVAIRFNVTFVPLRPCYEKISAGLTIVANVAVATGPAFFGAPQSSGSTSYLLHYTVYKIFFNLRNQYFVKFAVISKQRFSIEGCLCPEILVWFFLYSYITKGIKLRSAVLLF